MIKKCNHCVIIVKMIIIIIRLIIMKVITVMIVIGVTRKSASAGNYKQRNSVT